MSLTPFLLISQEKNFTLPLVPLHNCHQFSAFHLILLLSFILVIFFRLMILPFNTLCASECLFIFCLAALTHIMDSPS